MMGNNNTHLDAKLLVSERNGWPVQHASNVKGSYSPMQYVVRLHPAVQAALNRIDTGTYIGTKVDYETLSAFSTYLHETIHWWQHIGSTAGFIMSLSYPAQTHINHSHLGKLNSTIGPTKSLRRLHNEFGLSFSKDVQDSLNIVLNNWHDIDFCYRMMLDPNGVKQLVDNPYFLCIGHSYQITWRSCIWLLSQTIDPALKVIPDPRKWEDQFWQLRESKTTSFHEDSPVYLPPIGTRAIFEAQARFGQIQYLHFAMGGALDWDDFNRIGMMHGIYVEAFDWFLRFLGEAWPDSVDHPLVALFLLVCDLSLNPGEGFPFDIANYPTFVLDNDPGTRFTLATQVVRDKSPSLKSKIKAYSRSEYMSVSESLCESLLWPTPAQISEAISSWPERSNEINQIMKEDASFKFRIENQPIRVFAGRMIAFQRDKHAHPEFFVWPGVWSTNRTDGDLVLEDALTIFDNNAALFVDAPDGEIRPRLIPGRSEQDIYETFTRFYAWNVCYLLARQWYIVDGPFSLDFSWLSKRQDEQLIRSWASDVFRNSFGYDMSDFRIL